MNRTTLLKQLLPGLIPLLVFVVVDEIWGTRVGLIIALVVGLAELLFTLIREKRLDKFILLDTALLVVLGGVAIVLDNDIFFKIKPAIIEAIMCAIIGLSAFTKIDLIGGMTKRYTKGVEINDAMQMKMKRMLRSLFWIFLAHTLLILFSAFSLSKEIWAFVSGVMFYLIFLLFFVVEVLQQKRRQRKQNKWAREMYCRTVALENMKAGYSIPEEDDILDDDETETDQEGKK